MKTRTFSLPILARPLAMSLALLLAMIPGVRPAGAQIAKADPKLEQEFTRIYAAWDKAFVTLDLKFLEQTYAEGYQSIGGDGNIYPKSVILAELKAGKDVIHSAKTGELKVSKVGDTVVVTSLWTAKETLNGRDVSGQSRWTDVWAKHSGRWQLVATHGSDTTESDAEATRKITQLYKEWDAADVNADVAALERILGDEYLGTSPDGTLETKARAIAELKSGEVDIESALSDELKITVYRNTAVATGRWTSKGKDKAKNQSWAGAHRFTDTWVRRDGRWQVVADHWSKIEAK